MTRRRGADLPLDILNGAFIFIVLVVCLYPVIYVLSTSFSESDRLVMTGNVNLLPKGFTLAAYRTIFMDRKLPQYYVNSIFYALASTAFQIFITSLLAYPLSIKTFSVRKPLTLLMLITMYFSGGLIPYYLLLQKLGLVDSRLVMIVPGGLAVWNVIIFKTFFQQDPVELREAAYIDGANDFTILFRIVWPLSKPLLATFAIFGIVGSWNDYFTAFLFLNSESKMPIQILLRRILIEIQMQKEMDRLNLFTTGVKDMRVIQSAVIMTTIAPILLVYPFFQKYFARGILLGSLKG